MHGSQEDLCRDSARGSPLSRPASGREEISPTRGDALVLANIFGTDARGHRPLLADTDQARTVTVPART
ncbi:hypothetical protein QF047_002208 [Arthrobacter sp. W4I7]|nr:hypothetical protein [Arthrobacter sp. W4I7]